MFTVNMVKTTLRAAMFFMSIFENQKQHGATMMRPPSSNPSSKTEKREEMTRCLY